MAWWFLKSFNCRESTWLNICKEMIKNRGFIRNVSKLKFTMTVIIVYFTLSCELLITVQKLHFFS